MNVFMLAAGLGTRLSPLTLKYPKPCVPFLNVPLGLYNFRFFENLPITDLTVNTFHLPEKTVALYENQPYYQKEIRFSNEKNKILGSSGGLKQASRYFSKTQDTVLMLNSDEVLFDVNSQFLNQAYEQHLKEKNLATLVVMKHPEAGKKFGAIWCDGTRVSHVGKTPTVATQTPYHYIGMIFLNSSVLNLIPEDTETNIFYDILIAQLPKARVAIHEISCRWYETGNPADFFLATQQNLETLDGPTLQFINCYDESSLIKNTNGCSLVSKKFQLTPNTLSGYNVISKTTNPDLIKNLGSVENLICFENEILNEKYFKV